jgi:hypothetical protein
MRRSAAQPDRQNRPRRGLVPPRAVAVVLSGVCLVAGGPRPAPAAPVTWGWNGHAYEAVLVPAGISWHEARWAAAAGGARLVSISSREENEFVYSLVDGHPEYWYFNRYRCGVGPWIGGFQPDGSPEPDGGWEWETGEPFLFTCWARNEPNNFPLDRDPENRENAVTFFGVDGRLMGGFWNDYPAEGDPATGRFLPRGYIVEWIPYVLGDPDAPAEDDVCQRRP